MSHRMTWHRTTRRLNSITGLLLLSLFATILVINTYFYVNQEGEESPLSNYNGLEKPLSGSSDGFRGGGIGDGLNWLNGGQQQLRRRRPPMLSAKYLNSAKGSPFNVSALGDQDLSQLLNLNAFRFTINNLRCSKSVNNPVGGQQLVNNEVYLLIFIHSAPTNFEKRNAIRRTWGNESNFVLSDTRIRVVFMLGQVVNESVQRQIKDENYKHLDIVQGNFVDSYRNLSYKHVMGLKWVTYYCQNVRWVFKTDDDIFVDIYQLIYYIKGWHSDAFAPPRNFMSCYVVTNPYPKRSVQSKWHVTYEEYSGRYYPEYCSGWGILMSPDVVFNLYLASKKVPFFWVDDVLVSGLLAKEIGIRHIDLTSRLAIGDEDIDGWLNNKELSIPPLFGHPDTDTNTIYALWNKSIKYYKTKYKNL